MGKLTLCPAVTLSTCGSVGLEDSPAKAELLGTNSLGGQKLERKATTPSQKAGLCTLEQNPLGWLPHPNPLVPGVCRFIFLSVPSVCLSSLSFCLRMVEDVMSVCSLL